MKSFLRRFLEVVFFAGVITLVALPATQQLWAQGASLMMGRTTSGLNKIIQTDSSGLLTTVLSGVTIVPVTATFSALTTSTVTQTLVNSNTSRVALGFYNVGPTYSATVSTTTPVGATSGIVISAGGNYARDRNVPTGAWYVIGCCGSATTIVIEEDTN